jgi:hypothetical protein
MTFVTSACAAARLEGSVVVLKEAMIMVPWDAAVAVINLVRIVQEITSSTFSAAIETWPHNRHNIDDVIPWAILNWSRASGIQI